LFEKKQIKRVIHCIFFVEKTKKDAVSTTLAKKTNGLILRLEYP